VGRRGEAAMIRRITGARSTLDAERRALDRLDPRAGLAADRELVGRLLDRAARSVTDRIRGGRTRSERDALRLQPLLATRLAAGRSGFEAAAAGLAALAPQATLDRGYAIVRLASDGAVVRAPEDVPADAAVEVTVARGSFAARRLPDRGEGR
jgi:exonuclease VII large subunit